MSVLVGREAPNFIAQAVFPDGSIKEMNLREHCKDKYVVLFFYPLNFTFVCPSEIIAFSNRIQEFKKRNTELIGVSVDSQYSHMAYRKVDPQQGGIGEIKFPLVSDLSKSIASAYDVLTPATIALRATFIIDKNGIVKHQLVNDLPLGRNIQETIRTLDALQYYEENGEVCPANWNKGKPGMKPDQQGVSEYLKANAKSI